MAEPPSSFASASFSDYATDYGSYQIGEVHARS
jgi:hypothetical protein